MKWIETKITSKIQMDDLLGSLSSLRIHRQIKLIRGNFDSGTAFVNAEFKIKGTAEVWHIYFCKQCHRGRTLSRVI